MSGISASDSGFDSLFLIYSVLSGVLAIFFFSYFNRLFALIVSYGIRAYTWHRFGVFVHIQSLQISLLAGRVFFTGLRYHGSNETFLIQNAHITWCYWLRRVRTVELASLPTGEEAHHRGTNREDSLLPCRISVSLKGLQWFIYNRTPAYDHILSELTSQTPAFVPPSSTQSQQSGRRECRSKQSEKDNTVPEVGRTKNRDRPGLTKPILPQSFSSSSRDSGNGDQDLFSNIPPQLQFLPIHVDCEKAAVVMSNENCPAVLIVKSESFSGEVDACHVPGIDPYRQTFQFGFNNLALEMRDNADFREAQSVRYSPPNSMLRQKAPMESVWRKQASKFLHHVYNLLLFRRKHSTSFPTEIKAEKTAHASMGGSTATSNWQGLSRYLDNNDGDGHQGRTGDKNYAVSSILNTPNARVVFYWDVPALVPEIPQFPSGVDDTADINRQEPPAWGVDISIQGGLANYGPHADTQRAEIQRVFFPALCKDSTPVLPLQPGAPRVPTKFKVNVDVQMDVVLRVSFQESKRWRLSGDKPLPNQRRMSPRRRPDGHQPKHGSADAVKSRPSGWIDVKIARDSSLSYVMDMFAGNDGYSNLVAVDVPRIELSTSINQDVFCKAGPFHLSCNLAAPLKWNGLRSWIFSIRSSNTELFLLRDHVFLLTDLTNDWTSGPPSEYPLFIPFRYDIKLEFQCLKLYLNVNDANVINRPTALDDNTFLIFDSPELFSTVCIPADRFRPRQNVIPFEVRSDILRMSLNAPRWNTQSTFVPSTELGQVENVMLNGRYHYDSAVSVANAASLVVDLAGRSPSVRLYGFLIRYLILLKNNYMGDDVHFTTVEEYQQLQTTNQNDPMVDSSRLPSSPVETNDIDIILNVKVDDLRMLLPTNIYDCRQHLKLEGPTLSVDVRVTSHYIDLDLLIGPISVSYGSTDSENVDLGVTASNTQLFLDGLHVYGNRLLGLPPTHEVYLCNWDVDVGAVSGECSVKFLAAVMKAGSVFGFTLDDDENALVPFSSTTSYDVTFLRMCIKSARLWLHVDEEAVLISTGSIKVVSNDWARSHYSKRADIHVANIEISCVDAESAARHRARPQVPVDAGAFLKTTVQLAIIGRKCHFSEERAKQQTLVRREDERTTRTPFLQSHPSNQEHAESSGVSALCLPSIPSPVVTGSTARDLKLGDTIPFAPRRLTRQSSFISMHSSVRSVVHNRPGPIEMHRSPGRELNIRPDSAARGRRMSSRRDNSTSTGCHSAFFSAVTGDLIPDALQHSSVSFSSQFIAPHFPLENVQPTLLSSIPGEPSEEAPELATQDGLQFSLSDVDARALSEDYTLSSYVLELPLGISACLSPSAIRNVASLLTSLQSVKIEDVLDGLQTDTVSDIIKMKGLIDITGQIREICLKVPVASLRFSTIFSPGEPGATKYCGDQFDLTVTNVALNTRTSTRLGDPFKPASHEIRHLLHLQFASCGFAICGLPGRGEEALAAVKVQLNGSQVSFASHDTPSLCVDVCALTCSVASSETEYFLNMIQRGSLLVSDFKTAFRPLSRHKIRTQFLVHRLVCDEKVSADPLFLVRPSAILRFAKRHLRTFDSWKLISHLRQIWSTSSIDNKKLIEQEYLAGQIELPANALSLVVSAFHEWRGWDLSDLSDTILLRDVFGPPKKSDVASSLLAANFFMKDIQCLLDPGPKQNMTGIKDLTFNLEQSPPGEAASIDTDSLAPLTMVSVVCAQWQLQINWDICEFVKDTLQLHSQMAHDRHGSNRSELPVPPPAGRSKSEATMPELHIVFIILQGVVDVESVNLTMNTLFNGLKSSFIMTGHDRAAVSTNLILSADAVTSRTYCNTQPLGTMQLWGTSVFLSHAVDSDGAVDCHIVKSTVSSHGLVCHIMQDPVVLLEVMDTVVKDEAAQLHRLMRLMLSTSAQPSRQSDKNLAERLSTMRVNFATFLNKYHLSLPISNSMTYHISGVVTRATLAANSGKEFIFDFDIKENTHDVKVSVKDERRSISLLRIPPTNGRVIIQLGTAVHTVTVSSSVELVQLDASAVYSLLRALNKPQISSAMEEIKEQWEIIRSHASEIFDSDTHTHATNRTPSPEASLVYVIHFTLEGLEVFGDTPLKSPVYPSAHLSWTLSKVYVEVLNQTEPTGPILARPEIYANVKKVNFGILRERNGELRSCGSVAFGATISVTSRSSDSLKPIRAFSFRSDEFIMDLAPETVSTVIDVLGYMGDKIKDIDTSKELDILRKLKRVRPRISITDEEGLPAKDILDSFLSVVYQFEIRNIRVSWLVVDPFDHPVAGKEDLILSVEFVELGTRTQKSARLKIQNFMLQMVPTGHDPSMRSHHSALLPEVIFNVAYISNPQARRFAFQAVGKSLDLRLTSGFIVPAANLKESILLSIKNVRNVSDNWSSSVASTGPRPAGLSTIFSAFQKKRLESLLVDADFAGAVVYVAGYKVEGDSTKSQRQPSLPGKYGQFNADDSGSAAVLRSPGLASKVEYRDNGHDDPHLYGEIKIDASNNILYPSVVPLVMEIMAGVKQVVSDDPDKVGTSTTPAASGSTPSEEEHILTTDPTAVIGRLRLNLGLRICRQEFSLSCQPIARVAATACFDAIYLTCNTVRSQDLGNFFAISGSIQKLQAGVQHVYSRDPTGSFELESITLSLMNSKHLSGTSGVSAILNISPMKILINAKQAQDFLLFWEIWYPGELRQYSDQAGAKLTTESSQSHLVRRYQQVAATAAFPWNATASIASLDIKADLGQSIGKPNFVIKDLWLSSKKTSGWEQNLCVGFDKIGIKCTGRLNSFVEMYKFRLRTSIEWPEREQALMENPLIQASIGFSQFQLKTTFDYQTFLVADITSLEFLMFNVRRPGEGADRLVAMLDGGLVQVFATTTSSAQAVTLYRVLEKLLLEKRSNYQASIREIEKFTRRRSRPFIGLRRHSPVLACLPEEDTGSKAPISLDQDVFITLREINVGIFPASFSDQQVFKVEVRDGRARFAARLAQDKIHSILGLTLGQLRIGLAAVREGGRPKPVHEVLIEDVVQRATESRGGTILKVPKVEAIMQTWQTPKGNRIDYIFTSAFGGKVEVGWNYARISYIRGMWANHTKTLEQTWGRRVSHLTAIKVTSVPNSAMDATGETTAGEAPAGGETEQQRKITAEVKVPLSRFEYVAIEPPVIETPQLRDMGEATPPLEWIGLQRERLPNLTHQIVIVSLLELAGEVEDAYTRILGSS